MGSAPGPGQCVHCLGHFETLTWDHVFPKSWYPDTTPPNIAKWKIPACTRCNRDYGRLEEDLLWRLGLSIDPADQASLGVTDRVLKSVKPGLARSAKDREARRRKMARIVTQLSAVSSPTSEGLLPNFGLVPGLDYPVIVSIPIDQNALIRLGQKIIRGVTYLESGSLIDSSYSIRLYFLEDDKGHDFITKVRSRGQLHESGPGISVTHAKTDEGGLSSLWFIEIWRKLKMCGVVIPSEQAVAAQGQ